MTLTPEQSVISEYLGSIAIDAGAGSGKTYVLVRRMLGLLSRELRAEELVAVTFTEAAAAELRARLQALLDEEARRHAQPQVVAAARALPLAQISTIHALCARIIREHPVESGVGLRFEVLDEAGATAWLERTLPGVLGEIEVSAFGALPAGLARDALNRMLRDPQRAADALRVALDACERELPDVEARLARQDAEVETEWQACLATLSRHACPVADDGLEVARRAALQAAAAQGSWATRKAAMYSALQDVRSNAGNAKFWGGAKERVLAAVNCLRALSAPTRPLEAERWQLRAVQVLEGLYRRVEARLDALKAEHEVLTFADLERFAAAALTSPSVRAYYAERWKAVFIDEFQDTSPLQWQILSALGGGGVNVTIVGDEKQSIYAFRGADVRLFRTAREQVTGAGGINRSLNRSFRTHQALVEVMNAFFESYMLGPGGAGSTAATFTPLTAHRQTAPSSSSPCELHQITGQASQGDLRAAEAALIAHRVQSLMAEGRLVTWRGQTRPLEYRDIALLLRTRTHLSSYESALFHAGIPYSVQGGRGLLGRPEVRDLVQLLQFLARPGDDLALAALLRSLLLGWSDERLVQAAQNREAGQSLWEALQALGEAPGLLTQLMRARAGCSASTLLTRALEASEHAVVMASVPDGARRLANVDAFLSLLHSWAARGHASVQAAAQRVQEALRLDLPIPEATLASDDAVQIMTIHGSKGLEFPVVIVADLLAEGRAESAPVLFDAEQGLALRMSDLPREQQTVRYQQLQAVQDERDLAEHERILYVAMTRAADTLVLTMTSKPSKEASARALLRHFPDAGVVRFTYAPAEIPRPQRQAIMRGRPISLATPTSGLALPETLPVTSIGVYLSCPQAFAFRYISGRPPFTSLWEPETQQREGGVSGAIIGAAVHQAIELGLSPAQIRTHFQHLSEAERQEVADLTAVLAGPAFSELAGRVPRREVQVSHALGGLMFEGVIDAHYGDWIVDFKTDRRLEPAEHAPQLAVYLDATGASRASLAYLRHNQLRELTPAELQLARLETRRMVDGVQRHAFDPTPSTAGCRWCMYRQVCAVAE